MDDCDSAHETGGRKPIPPASERRLREANERLVIAALREQEMKEAAEGHAAEMDALLGSLHDGVVVLDPRGRITMMNDPARRVLRVADGRDGAVPANPLHLDLRRLDGEAIPECDSPFHAALRGERYSEWEYLLVHPGESPRRISFSGSAVRDATEAVVCALIVCRDVTEIRALERLKQDYLSLISHDLRNPLTAILFLSDLVEHRMEAHGEAESRLLLQKVQREAERMETMIAELLDSARIDAGGLVLLRTETDLLDLVATIRGRLGPAECRVHVDVDEAIPPAAVDPAQVERVIVNLITNALKYSPGDSPVTIRLERAPDEVRISVIDHGRGIARDDLLHVFDRYFRVSQGNNVPGVGLGLYISRMIVEEHGGRIWAESTLGTGSVFTFTLPVG